MHENRKISCTSWSQDQDRSAKAINQTADMIRAGSLDSGSSKVIVTADASAAYAPVLSGHRPSLLFVHDGALIAQPFDWQNLELSGERAVIVPEIGYQRWNQARFSVSSKGVLLYQAGCAETRRSVGGRTRRTRIRFSNIPFRRSTRSFHRRTAAKHRDGSHTRRMKPGDSRHMFGIFPVGVTSGRYRVRAACNRIGAAMGGNSSIFRWMEC